MSPWVYDVRCVHDEFENGRRYLHEDACVRTVEKRRNARRSVEMLDRRARARRMEGVSQYHYYERRHRNQKRQDFKFPRPSKDSEGGEA